MIYELKCESCGKHDERYIRLVSYDKEIHKQKCEACDGHMIQVIRPAQLAGLDSGPCGFMSARTEQDGCADSFIRSEVEANLGHKIGGGMFVPGLARPNHQFDPYAVVYSRAEAIQKAREQGVSFRDSRTSVEPRQAEPVEDDGVPSVDALKPTIIREVQEKHGGKVTGRQYKKIVAELQDKHSRKPPKSAKTITDTEFRNILKASKIVGE